MINKEDEEKLIKHSKNHKGGMISKHMKNMIKFMKSGDTFKKAHNKAVLEDKQKMPKLVKISKSDKPKKKFVAIFKTDKGKEKKTYFGAAGMNDYTLTGDKEARERYRTRHKKDLKTNDPTRAGFLSYYLLWGDSTNLKENIKKYIKDFDL